MTRRAAVALLFALAVGCVDTGPDDAMHLPVVAIDGSPRMLADFEMYLQTNLLPMGAATAALSEDDEIVRSRLFDAFVDEQLLLAEARRRGIRVDGETIDAALAADREESRDAPPVSAAARRMVEQRLLLARLEHEVVDQVEPPDEAAVRAWLAERVPAAGDRRVRLRGLRFEELEVARRVLGELQRKRKTVDEVIAQYDLPPEQGVPIEMALSATPPTVREAIEGLRVGQVGGPAAVAGGFYLFRVESWMEAPEPDATDLERARNALLADRRQRAYRGLLDGLRAGSRVELKADNLPFRYRADEE